MMKYSREHPPIACIQRGSTCYQGTTRFTPQGILWHDTDGGNPNISRYVQPLETDADYDAMIALLGKNRYGNDWNHKPRQAGMNAFIGKLADGTVTSVQTMPWEYAPWGCGAGRKGSLNAACIQFEICDDGYESEDYFRAVYQEACQLTAYLCHLYHLDPLGSFTYKGVEVPVITSHAESYQLKLGSNHGDPLKWLAKFGKTMEDVRTDVAKLLGMEAPLLPTLSQGCRGEAVKAAQTLLTLRRCKADADGIFGPKTKKAAEDFQKQENLPRTGSISQADWLHLLGVEA